MTFPTDAATAAAAAATNNSVILTELETAAQILLAPPNLVSSGQRHAAESVFLGFRKTENPYQLCKYILETSKAEYVLFEAAGLLKDGLIREWRSLHADFVKSLRTYLLTYVIQHPTLSSFVRERIVLVIAIIVKRQSIDDFGQDRRALLAGEVQQLITSGNMQMQMIGCSIISALMTEYATTVKSSDVGLPWEVHFRAKKQFELTDLKSIFEFCIQALKELTNSVRVPIPPETNNLLLRLSTLAESVLSWTFINVNLPKKLISVFESEQNPSLRPGAPWKDTILDPSIIQLFVRLHLKIRHDSELAHHSLNCLVQLSSLNGTVMTRKEYRMQYLTNYVKEFLGLLSEIGVDIKPLEALGCSNIIRKLMLFFPPSLLVLMETPLLQEYLSKITQLTCHFMKASHRNDTQLHDDPTMYSEAFEHMLEAWPSILHESLIFPTEFCRSSAIEIFNTFIQCNLCAPDGIRGQGNSEDDEEEIGDNDEESDRIRHKCTLSTIGSLGREAPDHSLTLLAQLLETRLSRLHGQIQRIASQGGCSIDKVLSDLYEDIHWILLIAGNVLTLDTNGEMSFIPSEIMRYSVQKTGQVNVETSLRVLASPGQPTTDIPGYESTDPVIRLIAGIFKLAEVERRAVEAGLASLLSPEVSSSVLWILRRFVLTYLSAEESHYTEISMSLVTAFGQNTEGAAWTISFLLEKVLSNLTTLNSEPKVVQDTVFLLVALVDGKENGCQVLKSPGLINLIELEASNQLMALPSEAKRGLMKALVLVGASCEDGASKDIYWQKVLKPLSDKFNGIICRPNLKKIYNEDKVRNAFISIIESFIGVIQGSHVSTVQQLFQFLQPVLQNVNELLNLYHNYSNIVELILELYCETARNILCYLNQLDSRMLYQRSVDVLRIYTHHNQGKRSVEKEAEEEQFRDLLLLMELLTNLLSKDFIDLAPPESGNSECEMVTAADVCLFGLNIIMPLMSLELLKFPSLCLQYFKTVTLICEIYPEKICNLNPPELQKNLVRSLELGLTTVVGVDTVFTLCCDFIQALCSFIIRSKTWDFPIYEALRPFLKLMLDLVLSQRINSDLMPNTSSTLYLLMCCYRETYQELVQYLIQTQTDPNNKERLITAFAELIENLPMTGERIHRLRFRDRFEKFIVNVRGFLLVK